jgi:hypothetical protein
VSHPHEKPSARMQAKMEAILAVQAASLIIKQVKRGMKRQNHTLAVARVKYSCKFAPFD